MQQDGIHLQSLGWATLSLLQRFGLFLVGKKPLVHMWIHLEIGMDCVGGVLEGCDEG